MGRRQSVSWVVAQRRLMYFKSDSVTSKLLGSIDIESRTGGKDVKALQLARTDDDEKTSAILLLFDTSASMKGLELEIESSIHMQQK
jgi:hypothetical protein